VEIFNLRKLNELEVRKKYQIQIPNRFAALEKDIKRAWERIKKNIKISAKQSVRQCELQQHKPRFDEALLSFLDQRKGLKCIGYRIQTEAM
jgi:DNA-binding ferritin-like protein (Dps family)